jgi:hypothetical protein
MAKLTVDPQSVPHFSLVGGFLRFNNRIWVGQQEELQQKIISAMHDSAVGVHFGVPVTYRCLKQLFAWKGMKVVVQKFVQPCLVCQQAKPDRCKCLGLLQPLPVVLGAWQLITMDFVEGLPTSGGFNCILVVV